MKALGLTLLLFLVVTIIHSQTAQKMTYMPENTWKVAYSGNNLVNPGLSFGFERSFNQFETHRKNNKDKKNKAADNRYIQRYYWDANLGFYWDPNSHVGAYNYFTIGTSHIKPNGFYSALGVGPGIYRSFLPETYVYNSKGEITRKSLSGNFYGAPVLTYSIGRIVNNNSSSYLKLSALTLVPYNNAFVPLINVDLGVNF